MVMGAICNWNNHWRLDGQALETTNIYQQFPNVGRFMAVICNHQCNGKDHFGDAARLLNTLVGELEDACQPSRTTRVLCGSNPQYN